MDAYGEGGGRGPLELTNQSCFAFHNHLYRNLPIIMFILPILNLQIKGMELTKVFKLHVGEERCKLNE
jgi:hypothetical protein